MPHATTLYRILEAHASSIIVHLQWPWELELSAETESWSQHQVLPVPVRMSYLVKHVDMYYSPPKSKEHAPPCLNASAIPIYLGV